MQSLRNELRYVGRRYVPWVYEKYLGWRNFSAKKGQLEDWQDWDKRADEVASCPDNARIEHVPAAGTIVGKWQIMHNGLRVLTDCYYGRGGTRLLRRNQGCHEPQEELMFSAVLSKMQAGAIMIECGAYWSFYSMWFCQAVAGARSYMVEPDLLNLRIGRRNFAENGFKGHFTNAYVGEAPSRWSDGTKIVAMDEFAAEHGLTTIDILHCDIQGAEIQMMRGAKRLLNNKDVRYMFVSTHRADLHQECFDLLQTHGYLIVSSVNLDESYSFDGIIVAARPGEDLNGIPEPSKRKRDKAATL